jgi:nucleoside-diphosphate-sugar epimerase
MSGDPVVVTGAAGLIGSAVQRLLRRRRVPVLALVRPGIDEGETASRLSLDLASTDAVAALQSTLPRISGIVHCAASFPAVDSGPDAERCAANNARLDANVAALARMRRVRVVYCSSVSVYGDGGASEPVREDHELHPAGPYAESKLAGERVFSTGATSFALLRISSPYGYPLLQRTVLRTFVQRALVGDDLLYFGAGERTQDFVHADDVAAACVSALVRTDFNGAVNICAGSEISMRALAQLVARTAGDGVIARSVDQPDVQSGRRALFDRTLALKTLGWEPSTMLEQGVADLLSAMRGSVVA